MEGDISFPALAARAQIEALRTSRHPDKRRIVRWRLTRSLYESGYGRAEIQEAFRLLAWMMRLPEPELLTFRQELIDYEKAKGMPVLTDIEEYVMKEARQEGRQEGLLVGKIQLLQEMLGEEVAEADALALLSLTELEARWRTLDADYRVRFKS